MKERKKNIRIIGKVIIVWNVGRWGLLLSFGILVVFSLSSIRIRFISQQNEFLDLYTEWWIWDWFTVGHVMFQSKFFHVSKF